MTDGTSTMWEGSSTWEPPNGPESTYNPRLSLRDECMAMIKYASERGKALPDSALDTLEQVRKATQSVSAAEFVEPSLADLAHAHKQLAAVIAPATPSTILLLTNEAKKNIWRYFGPTRYARTLSILAVGALGLFLVLQIPSLSHWVAAPAVLIGLASLLGALFYALFSLNGQLKEGSFDQTQEGTYTTLIILGMLAGLSLAYRVLPSNFAGNATADNASHIEVTFSGPLLALLGGFSAKAVYRILERLVTTLEALVRGSGEEMLALQQKMARVEASATTKTATADLAGALVIIQAQLEGGAPTADILGRLRVLIEKLLTAREDPSPGS